MTDRFEQAVAAIDAGDVAALRELLTPELVQERADCGTGYFARPYLLWFVAENPIRNNRLPTNIATITQTLIDAGADQVDYTLALVCSGRVTREQGVQIELIDTLVANGADPNCLTTALAHHENEAAARLLEHGATETLLAQVCLDRPFTPAVDPLAFAGAALHGKAGALRQLIAAGNDVNAFNPEDFHSHGTALHHAAGYGSLETVKVLVEAGADIQVRDRIHGGSPLGWAEYEGREEIAAYLRANG